MYVKNAKTGEEQVNLTELLIVAVRKEDPTEPSTSTDSNPKETVDPPLDDSTPVKTPKRNLKDPNVQVLFKRSSCSFQPLVMYLLMFHTVNLLFTWCSLCYKQFGNGYPTWGRG